MSDKSSSFIVYLFLLVEHLFILILISDYILIMLIGQTSFILFRFLKFFP
ncbi:hypothetical protein HMPREF9420_1061 [Segatella salivae DSM 15606]|uniref:Uncharacterized protein n=1 Tax=Segatella salivae DSM 15606 TaxID=888832 RepID=E6MNJ3_9BACT|nr:hypothetical protein HMPREF9420_1061 [Segatella salivae DSM 15606]